MFYNALSQGLPNKMLRKNTMHMKLWSLSYSCWFSYVFWQNRLSWGKCWVNRPEIINFSVNWMEICRSSLNSHFLITWLSGAGLIVIFKFHWHQISFLLDLNRKLEISELLSITSATWLILSVACLEDFKAFLVNQRTWWPILVIAGLRGYWQTKGTNQPGCPWFHFGSKISWLLPFSFLWKVLSHPRLHFQPRLSRIQIHVFS